MNTFALITSFVRHASLSLMSAVACVLIASIAHAAPQVKTPALAPVDVATFWVTPDQPTTLTWRHTATTTAPTSASANATRSYVVRNYVDAEVLSGVATITADRTLAISLTLPQGFYTLTFVEENLKFAVVSLPAFVGETDPYFCINCLMVWLIEKDATLPPREPIARIMKRCGIAMAREGLGWADPLQPKIDEWNWNSDRDYDKLYRVYAQLNLPIVTLTNTAPNHLGKAMGEGIHRFPLDMVGVVHSWRTMLRHWQSPCAAAEVWNEPDGSFGGGCATDQYGPIAKAMAYAVTKENLSMTLVGGVSCEPLDTDFIARAAANGVLNNIDAWSFHTYGHNNAVSVERIMQINRQAFKSFGRESMPLWNTESGQQWVVGPDRPSTEAEAGSALEIAMRGVEYKACGLTRYFPFVMPFYEEDTNNFGMLDRYGTPLRSMAAYATSIAMLAHREYVGDWPCDDRAVVRARVFANKKDAVAVIYTGKLAADAAIRVTLPKGAELFGIDGRRLTKTADGRVPIADGMMYVRLPNRESIATRVVADTAAMALWKIGHAAAPKRDVPSPIVLQFRPDTTDVYESDSLGYVVRESAPKQIAVPVQVTNLDDTAHDVTVRVTMGKIELGPAQTQRVGAKQNVRMEWKMTVDDRLRVSPTSREITVTATSVSVARIDPMMIRVRGVPTVESYLKRARIHLAVPVADVGRWFPSALPGVDVKMSSPAANTWQLYANFHDVKDRWVYPQFNLPAEMNLAPYKGFVFEARCQIGAPAVRMAAFQQTRTGEEMLMTGNIVASDNRWHCVYVPFTQLLKFGEGKGHAIGKHLRRISFGMNCNTVENTLQIRNVYLIGD